MAAQAWIRVNAKQAAEVAPRAELEPAALALLDPALDPAQFLAKLVAKKLLIDAIRFLAQALPHREAVWWALQCVRTTPLTAPTDGELLALAERWVRAPDDAAGRAAFAAAEKAGFKSGACWVGVSAFWSGPSIAPPGVATLPPAPELAGKAASGAILLAAVAEKPQEVAKRQLKFLELGQAVAAGAAPFPG
jgi:hypothetical protein